MLCPRYRPLDTFVQLDSNKHYGQWSGREIEAFLEETRVPLRLGLQSKNGPLIVPVWFAYDTQQFWSCSPDDSLLVTALRNQPEIAFDVSTNDLPYRGVRGRGVAQCSVAPDNSLLEKLLHRYVGNTQNALADTLLKRSGPEALIEIKPTWLTSWDFSARMEGIETIASRNPGAGL